MALAALEKSRTAFDRANDVEQKTQFAHGKEEIVSKLKDDMEKSTNTYRTWLSLHHADHILLCAREDGYELEAKASNVVFEEAIYVLKEGLQYADDIQDDLMKARI